MCRQSTNHVHRRFRRSVLLDALVPTVIDDDALMRALFEIFDQPTNHDGLIVKECVCEFDRRENELCL